MSTDKLRVLLVTTWRTACGVAETAAYLKESVEAVDPTIEIAPNADALDPMYTPENDLVHLNYHAALHSRWTPAWIRRVQEAGSKVLVTYHDSGVPNSDQCKSVCAAADYFIVHEPYDDLPAHGETLRMGVSGWPVPTDYLWRNTTRPILGTVGFPFPWKNYDELARLTAQLGWGLLLIAPTATQAQAEAWQRINPFVTVQRTFVDRDEVVAMLARCDATAFLYTCANTGQSGAILQGIAARKPVIALRSCRQFLALREDRLGFDAIHWADDFDDVRAMLLTMPIGVGPDAGIVALAEQESWKRVGARYAAIYRALAEGRQP